MVLYTCTNLGNHAYIISTILQLTLITQNKAIIATALLTTAKIIIKIIEIIIKTITIRIVRTPINIEAGVDKEDIDDRFFKY